MFIPAITHRQLIVVVVKIVLGILYFNCNNRHFLKGEGRELCPKPRFVFLLGFSSSEFVSGRFDTSGSMIPLLVSKISPCDGFCDGHPRAEELGILVVG